MNAFIADLRERRLLPIIALLLVCLIAVPFLLGGGGTDTPTPPAPTASTGEPLPGIEAQPVVIANPAELRSYKQRLAEFRSRNPFHQDLPKPVDTAATGNDAASSTGGMSDLPPGSTATPSQATTTPTSTPTPTTPSTPTAPPTTTPPTGSGGDGSSGDKLIDIRIDVKAGLAGNLKTIKNVKTLDYLPDRQHPVTVYAGGEFNLSSATFIVSPGIEATDGDGKCAPSPDNCQFLRLEPGDQQHFVYRSEDYTIKLLEVKKHVEPLGDGGVNGRDSSETPRGSVRNSSTAVDGG